VTSPVTSLTYDEIAEALGIERESARRLVIRKHWKRTKGNDGKARVEVPTDELPARVMGPVTADRQGQNTRHDTGLPNDAQTPDDTGEPKGITPSVPAHDTGERQGHVTVEAATTALTRHIERLEAEIVELRARANDRDLIAGQLEGLRLVIEEMRRERDDVRQDRDRWHTAATTRRPWWRRLAG
jgi:hypothetical protein